MLRVARRQLHNFSLGQNRNDTKLESYVASCAKLPNFIPIQESLLKNIEGYNSKALNQLLRAIWQNSNDVRFTQLAFRLVTSMRKNLHVVDDHSFILDENVIANHLRVFNVEEINSLPQNLFNYIIIKLLSVYNLEKVSLILKSNLSAEPVEDIWGFSQRTYHPRVKPELLQIIANSFVEQVDYNAMSRKEYEKFMLVSNTRFANEVYNLGRHCKE